MAPQRRRQKPKRLDLLFIQDTTGSQSPYINASIARCKDVCYALQASGQLEPNDGLRLGLLAFRDHRDDYVTKDFGGFTDSVDKVIGDLNTLSAYGGGDGPEAIAAALDIAFNAKWRPDAVKVAVLITDSPPHGIEASGDYYPDGDPNGIDPLRTARAMARKGIKLLLVACEPTLSNGYSRTHDFYLALTRLTSGTILPLTDATILAPLIVGFAFEQVKLETLVDEFTDFVINSHREGMPKAEIAAKLHEKLQSRGETVISTETTQVYKEPPESERAISIWLNAKDLAAGKQGISSAFPTKIPRVPREFQASSTNPWPKDPITVTMKNAKDFYITYKYSENGEPKSGTLEPLAPGTKLTFLSNTPYMFAFKVGHQSVSRSRTFTKGEVWDISELFY